MADGEAAAACLRRRVTTRPDGTVIVEVEAPLAATWGDPMTLAQIAKAFRVHRATLAERIATGELPALPFGSLWRVRADHLPRRLLGLCQ